MFERISQTEQNSYISVIDEAKKKTSTPLTPLRQIPVDVSQKSQRQTTFSRTPVVPGHKSFSEVTKLKITNSNNTDFQ